MSVFGRMKPRVSNDQPSSSDEMRLADVAFEGDALVARLINGSKISVDLNRYPRLHRPRQFNGKNGGGSAKAWASIGKIWTKTCRWKIYCSRAPKPRAEIIT